MILKSEIKTIEEYDKIYTFCQTLRENKDLVKKLGIKSLKVFKHPTELDLFGLELVEVALDEWVGTVEIEL